MLKKLLNKWFGWFKDEFNPIEVKPIEAKPEVIQPPIKEEIPAEVKPVEEVKPIEVKPEPVKPAPVEIKLSAYEIAKKEMGVSEIEGSKHNPKIIDYHATTKGKATTDEISWCSAFVNWCFLKAGIIGTNAANARSWLKWGVEVKEPKEGDVVVFWRNKKDSWEGHVAFFVRFDGNYVVCLGGNQSNKVCKANYLKSRVLGYRREK